MDARPIFKERKIRVLKPVYYSAMTLVRIVFFCASDIFPDLPGKLKELTDLTDQWNGVLYACVGIHPDNIKRVQTIAQFESQLEALHDVALVFFPIMICVS